MLPLAGGHRVRYGFCHLGVGYPNIVIARSDSDAAISLPARRVLR